MLHSLAQFEVVFIVLWLVGAVVGLVLLAFWIWMLVDCLRRDFGENDNDKIIWVLVIVFTGWVGAIIYFFIGRQKGRLPGEIEHDQPRRY